MAFGHYLYLARMTSQTADHFCKILFISTKIYCVYYVSSLFKYKIENMLSVVTFFTLLQGLSEM
jgi:hypothetical protein